MTSRSSGELFVWQGLSFEQADHVFKIGTDALLLATWVPRVVPEALSILDAGTGTGFLAIAMAAAFPGARVLGVDVNEDALALAGRNAMRNEQSGRMKFHQENICAGLAPGSGPFDLVISNPPYFDRDSPSDAMHDLLARHRAFEAGDWIRGCSGNLLPDGHLCLVVPAGDAFAWIRDGNKLGWYVRHRLDVRVFATDAHPKRTLLHMTTRLAVLETAQIALYRVRDEWHPEFLAWRDEAWPAREGT